MNIDIINIGHYRVTSHGGRAYDLFNRQTDDVWNITKDDWSYIMNGKDREVNCNAVDYVYRKQKYSTPDV